MFLSIAIVLWSGHAAVYGYFLVTTGSQPILQGISFRITMECGLKFPKIFHFEDLFLWWEKSTTERNVFLKGLSHEIETG
jgi:hypothetical protein